MASIPLTSTDPIFGFDGDGICSGSISPSPPGCPFGPTGYEGPGVSFASINSATTSGVVNFSPAIPPNQSAYFGLEEAIPTQCLDTDGDGLCDDWERNGLTVYVNGSPVFVDLPAMGADPGVPDIFVQADHMDATSVCLPGAPCVPGHTHQPLPQAIATVTQAFARKGITLHVDCGPTCVMNPKTGALWGTLSQAHTLAHQDTLGTATGTAPNLTYQWADFDTIKNANFFPARQQVFHYLVFAHNLGNLDGTSGISRGIPASDFIVSLGSWTASVGDSHEQGGTFMHELGHNLSFTHGGSAADGNVNYKPNYLSVMNYLFQTKGLTVNSLDFNYDYSESALSSLNEAALNEIVGLGPSSSPYGTRYFCEGDNPLTTDSQRAPVANGPIDWNCNGAVTDTNTATDINGDTARTVLAGFAGAAGSTVGWGYSIYNGTGDWVQTTNLTADVFSNGTPASIFDFPVIAPYSTASEQFSKSAAGACSTPDCGLFELAWDPTAPLGAKNSGFFTLSSEFYGTDPLTDPNAIDLGAAPDATAAYSATVNGTAAPTVPEPSSLTLLSTAAAAMFAWQTFRRDPRLSGIRP